MTWGGPFESRWPLLGETLGTYLTGLRRRLHLGDVSGSRVVPQERGVDRRHLGREEGVHTKQQRLQRGALQLLQSEDGD